MEIKFANTRQVELANLLWEATEVEEVEEILRNFGHDAQVAYHMLLASHFDSTLETDVAEEVLNRIFSKE